MSHACIISVQSAWKPLHGYASSRAQRGRDVVTTEQHFPRTRGRISFPFSHTRIGGPARLLYELIDEVVDALPEVKALYWSSGRYYQHQLDCSAADTDEEAMKTATFLRRDLKRIARLIRQTEQVVLRLSGLSFFRSAALTSDLTKTELTLSHLQADVVETVEMLEKMSSEYNTYVDNRMNKVLYLLTIVTTTFVPAQFFTGLYGMNFVETDGTPGMPELKHGRRGYFALLAIMLLTTLCLLRCFRSFLRKGVRHAEVA